MRIAIADHMALYVNSVFSIVQELAAIGGCAYIVGGSVRDMVLQLPLKDLDIEVHGISLSQLKSVLSRFGHVEEIGKKFGVLLILGLTVDWSLPRTDSAGRKPLVELQPNLDIEIALRRRDVTMNAMAINLTDVVIQKKTSIDIKEIIDPFRGLEDIQSKVIRAVDPVFFVQDPLRLLRVMQFAARFNMTPDADLSRLCASMSLYDETAQQKLACERMQAETKKLLFQAKRPAQGFFWINQINRTAELYPFLQETVDREIALFALDRAASLLVDVTDDERLSLFAALLLWPYWHRTQKVDIKKLLFAVTSSIKIIQDIEKVLAVFNLFRKQELIDIVFVKKIAALLGERIPLEHFIRVYWALFEPAISDFQATDLYAQAKKANVLYAPEEPLVLGRDLLDYVLPGPELGTLVKKAYELQLSENINDKAGLLNRLQLVVKQK